MVGREAPAHVLKLMIGRLNGLAVRLHVELVRHASAFSEIARTTGRHNVIPAGTAAAMTRDQMVKGQVFIGAAVNTGKRVTKENVEAGEGGLAVLSDELAQ